jgi:photoactive yellow protein
MTGSLCLDSLDDAALDRLPFGVVRLSPTGTVERFNRAEAERTNVQRWRVLGRDYFRDVAGPAADELAAQVEALEPGGAARVYHTFRGYHRADDAVIDISRCEEGRVYLCIRPTSRPM